MIPEFGQFALILAFCIALIQSTLPLIGSFNNNMRWMVLSRYTAYGQFLFLALSFICLITIFIQNDFSVIYVAENSNSQLPWYYRIPAAWGAHEGSLLLWVVILSFWTAAVAMWGKQLPQQLIARVLAILGLISVGFLWFTLATSSPFLRLLPDIPADGQDLNPILQDPGLAFHPPMLYMGYVGFAIGFAFAITALISGKVDAAWAKWTKPWVLIAWCFLTLGITLGSWWSYRELGWGGWWFWDPVENASLMPWLVGTALLHSLIVTAKRGLFKSWTILLAICAFSLSLLGTFLVRSGVLNSVHAFAADPTRGVFMLRFLGVVVGGSLLLFAIRAPKIKSSQFYAFFSRENFILLNNVLLIVAMATVLIGTIYPLMLDALTHQKISVGPPYFNTVFIPIAILLFIAMGIAPLCRWYYTSPHQIVKKLFIHLLISLIIAIFIGWLFIGYFSLQMMVALLLAIWITGALSAEIVLRLPTLNNTWEKFTHITRRQLAMFTAHLGVAVCVIGIAVSSNFSVEKELSMSPGDTAKVGPYIFQFTQLTNVEGPNYSGAAAFFKITRNGKIISTMIAQNRIYTVQKVAMSEAAIDAGIFRDLYIALGEPLQNNAWGIRLYYKPFVRWIWGGGILMLIGGLLAFFEKNRNNISRSNI